MHQTVSVDEAIKKGIYTVNLPALLIFMIGLVASFAMAFIFFRPYGMIVGLLISYVLATAYRTITAAKWRIWAFDKVRNVHELYERALSEKLIYLTNRPGFGIINYNTESQKKHWEQLEAKFEQPDIFIDDQSVTAENYYPLFRIQIRNLDYSIPINDNFWDLPMHPGSSIILHHWGPAYFDRCRELLYEDQKYV